MQVEKQDVGCVVSADSGERLADCDPAEVRELLRQQGYVYFTGFGVTMDEYQAFTARFGRCATPRTIEYPPGGVALGFHAEDSYNPWRPDALWFLCLAPGDDGGAPTGVVDGVGLLQSIDRGWQEFCLANDLRFNRDWSASEWQQAVGGDKRKEVAGFLDTLPGLSYQFLPDDTLRTRFDTPLVVQTRAGEPSLSNTALHAITDPDYYGMTLTDGSRVPTALLEHIEATALDRELNIGWETGAVAVIDNNRLMHRRGEYKGTGRELRVVHGEEFFGSTMPPATTPVEQALKVTLQGEETLR